MPQSHVTTDKNLLRRLRCGLTQAEAAVKANISAGTWSRGEARGSLSKAAVESIAAAFGVSPGDISPDLRDSPPQTPVSPSYSHQSAQPLKSRPILSHGFASAGNGIIAAHDKPEQIELPLGLHCIEVHGDSMSPLIRDGQRLLFDSKASVADGDVALVQLSTGERLCKRYYEHKGYGVVVLQSVEDEQPPRVVNTDEVTEVYRVVGILL